MCLRAAAVSLAITFQACEICLSAVLAREPFAPIFSKNLAFNDCATLRRKKMLTITAIIHALSGMLKLDLDFGVFFHIQRFLRLASEVLADRLPCFTLWALPATMAVFRCGAGIPWMWRYAVHFR
jgi:hypothetical protein